MLKLSSPPSKEPQSFFLFHGSCSNLESFIVDAVFAIESKRIHLCEVEKQYVQDASPCAEERTKVVTNDTWPDSIESTQEVAGFLDFLFCADLWFRYATLSSLPLHSQVAVHLDPTVLPCD
jgi:hypothetical protein